MRRLSKGPHHFCVNEITITRVNGRLVILVKIERFKSKARHHVVRCKVHPTEFRTVDRLFPGATWNLNNGYPAISTCKPDGTRTKVQVGRALEYLKQCNERSNGGRAPGTKGIIVRLANGDPLDLTPDNRIREKAHEHESANSYQTEWIIRARLKLMAQGKNPDQEFRARARSKKPKDDGSE